MQLPRLYLVRQHFPDLALSDVRAEAGRQLAQSGFAGRLKPGANVAIAIGSRGIDNIAVIVRAVVDYWKSRGMRPFLFPAMGSHGAATAEGQAGVLAGYGITEATMGAPVRSSLDVMALGPTETGIEAFMDRTAYESDGVFLVGRVKWHTDFAGKIESGLYKMMAIGLGKQAGAKRYHTHAYRIGLEAVIRDVGRKVLSTGRILGGLAILEDANHHTARLEAVPVEVMEQREEENLKLVYSWMPKVPVAHTDVLVVDEAGKDISGSGMDPKVINRNVLGHINPWPNTALIGRVFLRGLSAATHGNGVGFGLADMVTDRLVAALDWEPTRINALTASGLAAVKIPLHFPTDRQCLETLATVVGRLNPADLELVWIRNTIELGRLVMSETLLGEIQANNRLEILSGPFEFPFDEQGNLASLLAPQAGFRH
jgi:hypothetical protein